MARSSDSSPVQKICRILRALSSPLPLRLADVTAATALNKATALRLLDELVDEGFVQRDPESKRYALGDEALLLGIALRGRDDIRERARPWLVKLAGQTGDTILLSTRSGVESVCIDREFGAYPIRANYLDVGSRRPLGVGAGSMALLAWMPAAEARAVLDIIGTSVTQRYPRIDRDLLELEMREARRRGHSLLLDVVVERMGGIGVPVFGADGRRVAAISLAALNERITTRIDVLVPLLKQAANELSALHAHGAAA